MNFWLYGTSLAAKKYGKEFLFFTASIKQKLDIDSKWQLNYHSNETCLRLLRECAGFCFKGYDYIMESIQIFIDSGNFYHLVLKKLGLRENDFSFEGFAGFLANNRQVTAFGKRFYVGTVRETENGHENKTAMENQTRLFSNLVGKKWFIKTSKLRTRTERIRIDDRVINYQGILKKGITEIEYNKSSEKGIDVKLAVDLLVGAIDNQYDTAVVVSSDSDLIPAIDWVRKRCNKKVEYIGFSVPYINPQNGRNESTKPTKTMIYNSDIQRVLIESDVKPFIGKGN